MKSTVAVLERCPVCALPGLAGETDALGRRPECVPSDECVEAYWRALTDEQRLQTDLPVLSQLRRLRQARSVVPLLG